MMLETNWLGMLFLSVMEADACFVSFSEPFGIEKDPNRGKAEQDD